MSQKKHKKQKQKVEETPSFRMYDYSIRFAAIFTLYLIVLASLKYQAGVNYTEVFAIIAVILSAKFTSIKFITQQKRLFSKEERFKLIWSSWALAWFSGIIVMVISTAVFAGKQALNEVVQLFSAMPTFTFIATILGTSLLVLGLLYLSYSFLADKEYESLKKQEKI